MTIASELLKLQSNLDNSYTACSNKGATLPASQNFDNLASTISAIPAGTTPTLASLTITPSTTAQTITPPSGTDGYNTVQVSAVTAAIDSDIVAGNIKSGVEILGVNGTVTELVGETRTVSITSTSGNTFTPSSGKNGITSIKCNPTNQNLTITPTTTSQTFTVPSNYSGYGTVTCNAASGGGITPTGTYTITANGTYNVTNYVNADVNVSGSGGSSTLAPYNCTKEYLGDLKFSAGTLSGNVAFGYEEITISGARFYTSVYPDASQYASDFLIPVYQFNSTTSSSTFLNPAVTGAADAGYSKMFIDAYDAMSYVAASGATTIRKLYRDASNCPSVLNFGAITTLTMAAACQNAVNLEKVLFPNATKLSLKSCFKGCTSLHTFYAPKLKTLPTQALGGTSSTGGAFSGCTSLTTLSFPALTSTSFGSYTNQFDNMLKGVTGCTVHFPSNLQSVIGSWASVTGGFAGTNTTVLFDLPATT